MAGSNKEVAAALEEAGESSSKPTDSISGALPESSVPEKDELGKRPNDKSKEDPLNDTDDSDSDETGEDPSWMFYDTEDSSYNGSMDSKSDDDEPKAKKVKTDGEASDDDEPKAKEVKTDCEASDNDEPKTMKIKTDGDA